MAIPITGCLEQLAGKTCLIRVDFNCPLADGRVADGTRIERVLPGLKQLAEAGAGLVLISHLGRPKGEVIPEFSLAPVCDYLSEALGYVVPLVPLDNTRQGPAAGQIVMLENLRFWPEEEANDEQFAKKLAGLADVYVNDATKLAVLENLIEKVDILFLGGGMANTFLVAKGEDMGASLMERDLIGTAADIVLKARQSGCRVLLPEDGLAATAFNADVPYREIPNKDILATVMILDIGPKAIDSYQQALKEVRTVLWNGPMGAFEVSPFDTATVTLAQMVAEATEAGRILSVAGGGDTVAALNHAGVAEKFSYVSLAGGAFLEYIEGKTLPGVAVLSD